MKLKYEKIKWNILGASDPLWAIASHEEKKDGKWDIDEFFETGINEVDAVMRCIERSGMNINFKKALDFGCGVGRLTQALANYFDEVSGVDIAPSMIGLANTYNRQGKKCKYYQNSSQDLGLFSDRYFNFVYSIITLQHMRPKHAKKYLKEFMRILVPNGVLIFQLPSEPADGNTLLEKLKYRIKTILPIRLLDFYHKVRYGRIPPMEMFGIRQEEVIKVIEQNNGEVINIREDKAAGLWWKSFQYVVRKREI